LFDHQDGLALLPQQPHLVKYRIDHLGRQADRRLIKHDPLRLLQQGAGDLEHALLAARHHAGQLTGARLQNRKQVQHPIDALGQQGLVAHQIAAHPARP
jgi:hypothetical protein